jgi:iron(III) transport system substrate-binding protein
MSKSFVVVALMSLAVLAAGPVAKAADSDKDQWLKDARLGPYLPEQEDWNMVIEKAKEEGSVVVYSSTSRTGKLKKLFEETYPGVTLEAFKVETLQIIEKFSREQESEIFNADVIFNDAVTEMRDLYDGGQLYRYVPDRVKDIVPEYFQDWLLVHRWGPGQVIYYNPVHWPSKPDVNSLWDFTRKEWRGKIVMPDPLQHGGTLKSITYITHPDNAAALAESYEKEFGKPISLGDNPNAGYMFLAEIIKNGAVVVKSDDIVVEHVGAPNQSGVPPFGLFVTMSKMRKRGELGLDLDVLAPGIIEPFESFGLPPTSDMAGAVLGIAAMAPHPNAARLLIDFLMGDENGDAGNKPWHVIGNWSSRTDVLSAKGDIEDRSVLNTMPATPTIQWVSENKDLVRDFWLTLVF